MFHRIFTALAVPAILFGITFFVMAECKGPWCAGASVNKNGSYNRANASVSGGYSGCNVSSYTLIVDAGPNQPSPKTGAWDGYNYVSHKHKAAFSTEQPDASASITGTNKQGISYTARDDAP